MRGGRIILKAGAAAVIAALAAAFVVLFIRAAAAAEAPSPIDCLALGVYREARGEPGLGQIAVAYVIENRARATRTDACAVIMRQGQFRWPKRLPVPDRAAWDRSLAVARLVAARRVKDPTEGATFFHEVSLRPRWANVLTPTAVIGGHVFFVARGNA